MDAQSTDCGDPALECVLAMARLEILILATALQALDEAAVLIAATRLRCTLGSAGLLAARSPSAAFANARLASVRESSEMWLPQEIKATLSPARLRYLIAQLLEPRSNMGPIDASNAHLVHLDLADLQLDLLALRGARVTDVRADRAQLDAVDAATATIALSSFSQSSLRTAGFEAAHLEECDFSEANLERSRWSGATVSRCIVSGAVLQDARFDAATFIECDFRGADFSAGVLAALGAASSARFIRCDLRDTDWDGRCLNYASFIDCRLHGVHGAADVTGAAIERPDLSPQGDRSQVGSKSDVAGRWTRQRSATRSPAGAPSIEFQAGWTR